MTEDLAEWFAAVLDAEHTRAASCLSNPPTTTVYRLDGSSQEVPVGTAWWRQRLGEIEAIQRMTARADTLFCDCLFANPATDPDDRSHLIPHHYDCTAYRIARELAVAYADRPGYREEWRR